MSQENVEIVRRTLEAFSDRDADLVFSYMAADMEWEPAGPTAVEGAVYRGRVDVAGAIAALGRRGRSFASRRRRFATSGIRSSG
jgi:ketosteroid isomerase-like protein